jgi:hypothetical protein
MTLTLALICLGLLGVAALCGWRSGEPGIIFIDKLYSGPNRLQDRQLPR